MTEPHRTPPPDKCLCADGVTCLWHSEESQHTTFESDESARLKPRDETARISRPYPPVAAPVDPNAEQEILLHVVIRSTARDADKVARIWIARNKTFMGDLIDVYPSYMAPQGDPIEPMDWKAGEIHAD